MSSEFLRLLLSYLQRPGHEFLHRHHHLSIILDHQLSLAKGNSFKQFTGDLYTRNNVPALLPSHPSNHIAKIVKTLLLKQRTGPKVRPLGKVQVHGEFFGFCGAVVGGEFW